MVQRRVDNFLYEKESYEIRGACFNVYNVLGGGIKEKSIESALAKEFKNRGLIAKTQVRIPFIYKGENIGIYIPDVIVNDKIMIELKSKPFITKEDEKQFWGYLKNSPYQLGFLINFGSQRLTIKRFVYTKNYQHKSAISA